MGHGKITCLEASDLKPLSSPGIALRLEHPTVTPAEMTVRLALVPTSAIVGGPGKKRRNHYWIHRVRARSQDTVEEDVFQFLSSLEKHRDSLLEFRATGGTAAVYLTSSVGHPRGFEFGFGTMVAIGDLKLDFYVEVFGPTGDLPEEDS